MNDSHEQGFILVAVLASERRDAAGVVADEHWAHEVRLDRLEDTHREVLAAAYAGTPDGGWTRDQFDQKRDYEWFDSEMQITAELESRPVLIADTVRTADGITGAFRVAVFGDEAKGFGLPVGGAQHEDDFARLAGFEHDRALQGGARIDARTRRPIEGICVEGPRVGQRAVAADEFGAIARQRPPAMTRPEIEKRHALREFLPERVAGQDGARPRLGAGHDVDGSP